MTHRKGLTHLGRLVKFGGMSPCGGCTGVFVAPEAEILNCPPGWVFVALEFATPEIVQNALDTANKDGPARPEV